MGVVVNKIAFNIMDANITNLIMIIISSFLFKCGGQGATPASTLKNRYYSP